MTITTFWSRGLKERWRGIWEGMIWRLVWAMPRYLSHCHKLSLKSGPPDNVAKILSFCGQNSTEINYVASLSGNIIIFLFLNTEASTPVLFSLIDSTILPI